MFLRARSVGAFVDFSSRSLFMLAVLIPLSLCPTSPVFLLARGMLFFYLASANQRSDLCLFSCRRRSNFSSRSRVPISLPFPQVQFLFTASTSPIIVVWLGFIVDHKGQIYLHPGVVRSVSLVVTIQFFFSRFTRARES